MNPNTYDQYLRNEVMSADPLKLVLMLYRTAIEAVSAARDRLREGDIRRRSQEITRALRVVHELLRSLDRERGGEIAARLAQLYAYMSSRLIEANARQSDKPLAEVERLLATLLEGWSAIHAATPAAEEPSEYAPVSCSY
jgi:flagellar secretion chaperone FliS